MDIDIDLDLDYVEPPETISVRIPSHENVWSMESIVCSLVLSSLVLKSMALIITNSY